MTKMNTYKYIALAALALGFTACTQDEDFAPQQSDIVQIASANIATEVQSRVNTLDDGKSFDTDDAILLVNNTRDSKNEGTYTYNGATWSLTSGMVLYHSSEANSFTAYYPASKEFTLPTDQSTEAGIKSADRMTATATDVTKGTGVTLNFAHQNAKVTITSTLNTQYKGSYQLSDIKDFKINDILSYKSEDNYVTILEPNKEGEAGFTVTLKVGTDNLTATSSTTLEAGKHYTFTLTVGKGMASLTGVSVNPWTGATVADGEAEEIDYLYNESSDTYTVYNAEGLATALTNGGNVTLANGFDYTTTDEYAFSVPEGKSAVLDLNGKTMGINAPHSIAIESSSNETIATTLTINDSVGGGGVVNENSVYWGSLDVFGKGSILTINGGTFTGATGLVVVDGWDMFSGSSYDLFAGDYGTAIVNGGTFGYIYVGEGTLTINGGYVECIYYEDLSYSAVTITGGTFGFDPTQVYGIYAETTESLVDTDNYTVTKNTDADGNETWTVTAKTE